MRVFDFDNTIYDGESGIDFFMYYVKHFPFQIIKYIPSFTRCVIKYKAGKLSINDILTDYAYIPRECCLKFDDPKQEIKKFWDTHEKKVKKWVTDIMREDDLVLSASPEPLLFEICNRLGIKNVIGSGLDLATGEISQLCFRDNKIKMFKEAYGDTVIDEFYTDSMNDKPFMDISENVYFVTGDKMEKIKENGKYLKEM